MPAKNQQRLDRLIALANSGNSITAIAAQEGISKQRVHQIFSAGGFKVPPRPKRPKPPRKSRARPIDTGIPCHGCGKPLRRFKLRVDGLPRWCANCTLARLNWSYRNVPAFRARHKAYVQERRKTLKTAS